MNWLRSGRAVFGVAVLLACSNSAFAQTSAQPSHVDERFRPQPAAPSVGAPIEIPSTPQTAAPAGSESVTFTITGVNFQGNTALPDSELQTMAAAYIGHPITLAQVYELADKVTAAYRSRGFILAQTIVPAQKVSNGVLTLKIVQGYISQVKIQGDAGGGREYLEAYGARIKAVRPLTADVLERELLLVSDLTGFQVRSVLTPSATEQGAADLTLVVDRKPVDAYVAVDNRGSKYLGPYEVMAGVFINDAFDTGGRFGINAVVTPNSGPEMAYGAVSFDQPLGDDGMRLFTTLSYTHTKPGSVLAALDTSGKAINGDMALSYPFTRSRDFNFSGTAGVSYRDTSSKNALIDPLFSDHVRSVYAQLYINALDDWGGYSTLSGRLTQGVPVFGATEKSSPNKSRVGASGTYTRANFDASHEHPLFEDVSVLLAASGQTSFGKPLLASEQYSLGGYSFDRAFDPSQITGDSALAGKVELRWDAIQEAGPVSGVQLYGFYEGGEVWQSHALPGTPKHETLSSAGAGARFAVLNQLNADVEWADPLERDVLGGVKRDSRFLFSVGTNF
ncbi:MAG TPA: POTRA domain-containing protein [Rhizomicrobium sp.]